MEKKKISVFVAGQRFNLITDEEERYVIDLAAKVDARVTSISISQNMTRERAAVLTALDFADDVEQNRREMTAVKEQVKDYLTQIEALTAENSELKTQLSRTQHDNMALTDVQRLLAECDAEKEALKRQILALKEQIAVMQEHGYTEQADAPVQQDPAPEEEVPVPDAEDIPREQDAAPVQIPDYEEEEDETLAAPAKAAAPAAPVVTAEDDLFFGMPEEPVRPRKEKKRHHHPHENPYRQEHMKKKGEQKGYTQQRQYSFFDETDE